MNKTLKITLQVSIIFYSSCAFLQHTQKLLWCLFCKSTEEKQYLFCKLFLFLHTKQRGGWKVIMLIFKKKKKILPTYTLNILLIEAKVVLFFFFLHYLENYLDYGLCRRSSSLHLEKQNSWFIHICNGNESSVYEGNSSLSVIPRVLKAFFTSSCSSLWHSWRASFDSWLLFEMAGGRQLQTKQLLQPELIVLGWCFLFKI